MSEISASSIPGYRAGTWKLDGSHSSVEFSIRHLVSKVTGEFQEAEATLVTTDDPLEAKVTGSVKVASVSTRSEQRDQHLRTGDFFEADAHPELSFESTGVRADGDDFKVDGLLTIKGISKPVTFDVEFGGVATSPYGQTVAGIEATTSVDRNEWDLTWNSPLESGGVLLGDEVKIHIEAEFVLEQ